MLSVQPQRLDIVTLERAMTLREFAQQYAGSISLDVLTRLNQAEPTTRFERGDVLKRVTGAPPPGA